MSGWRGTRARSRPRSRCWRKARAHSLTARLASNGTALLAAYRANSDAVDQGQAITPAAEWLIDNYHLVERQIPRGPLGSSAGILSPVAQTRRGTVRRLSPRFGIAWAFVAHTDSRFDTEMLRRFILAYQEVQPLTIGELWALSITLRIVLIENLRRLADLIMQSREDRERANIIADRILGTTAEAPSRCLTCWQR